MAAKTPKFYWIKSYSEEVAKTECTEVDLDRMYSCTERLQEESYRKGRLEARDSIAGISFVDLRRTTRLIV